MNSSLWMPTGSGAESSRSGSVAIMAYRLTTTIPVMLSRPAIFRQRVMVASSVRSSAVDGLSMTNTSGRYGWPHWRDSR